MSAKLIRDPRVAARRNANASVDLIRLGGSPEIFELTGVMAEVFLLIDGTKDETGLLRSLPARRRARAREALAELRKRKLVSETGAAVEVR